MIFPSHCKQVGFAEEKPAGDLVYFLSRYLIRNTPEGPEVLAVDLAEEGGGLLRSIHKSVVLAGPKDTVFYPDRVNLHHRTDLILKAAGTGKRCTIFTGHDEHMTFVLDPDPDTLLHVHVYDIKPPLPHLSATLKELEATGLFGELGIRFVHHVRDIRSIDADIFPCRAAGFSPTLDMDLPEGGETIAGCLTGRQILSECYGDDFTVVNICPADEAVEEPFIARCCRSERSGTARRNGILGAVVHWGSSPREIAYAVFEIVGAWRNGV